MYLIALNTYFYLSTPGMPALKKGYITVLCPHKYDSTFVATSSMNSFGRKIHLQVNIHEGCKNEVIIKFGGI